MILSLLPLPGTAPAAEPLWDLDRLGKAPKVEWVEKDGELRKLYYEGEPYQGKPTRVFAYYAEPAKAQGKLPAMVLVHGGGGTAFSEWATLWAKRGYVAIAMDLAGCEPERKRLLDGGPGQGDDNKFPKEKTDLKDMWSYHGVATVIRAHSLLRSLSNVDAERTGVTGISWGGYLTCIVAGVDERFKVGVPVYGCGFLHENSVWLKRFADMDEARRKEWIDHFDPSKHVGKAKMPMMFVNDTNDFAYPLDSYQKTYRLVKDRALCVTVNMPHGHQQGWAPIEIGLFVDQHLKKGKPLFNVDKRPYNVQPMNGKQVVTFPIVQTADIQAVRLHWTTELDVPWQKRKWQTKDAALNGGNFTDFWQVPLPEERPVVYFLTATDGRKATVSTEHVTLEK